MKVVPSPYAARLAAIPVAQHETRLDGRTVAWWEYGDVGAGPALLFVHGFRGDHHGLESIAAFLPGTRIVAPDLPGFGLSAPLDEEHSIDHYAAWVIAFARLVGMPADTVVVGHSFGTIVSAAALASGLPAKAAVLLNPIAAPALEGPNAFGTRLADAYYRAGAALPERVGRALLDLPVVVRGAGAFLAKTRDRSLRRWIHNQHDRYFSVYANRRVVVEAYRASTRHTVREYAPRITVPVHLVAAEHDDITTVAAVRELQEVLPASTFALIPAVGHLVHYETPEAAAREIAAVAGMAPGS